MSWNMLPNIPNIRVLCICTGWCPWYHCLNFMRCHELMCQDFYQISALFVAVFFGIGVPLVYLFPSLSVFCVLFMCVCGFVYCFGFASVFLYACLCICVCGLSCFGSLFSVQLLMPPRIAIDMSMYKPVVIAYS